MDAVDLRTVVMDLTKRNIQLRDERDQLERQLAAAERLYFAATEGLGWLVAQEWEVSMSAIVALEKALEDYANAKEPQ